MNDLKLNECGTFKNYLHLSLQKGLHYANIYKLLLFLQMCLAFMTVSGLLAK